MDANPATDSGLAQEGPVGSSDSPLALSSSALRSDPFQDDPHRRIRLVAAACLIPLIFVIDIVTPANIEFKSLYVLVLIVAGGGVDGRGVWPWTLACLAASVATFAVQVDPAQDVATDCRFAIAIGMILCTALLVAQQSSAMALVRRQSRALDVAATAVLLRSTDGEILLWNRAAEELYGWSRREAVGQNADRLLASRFPEPLENIRAQLTAQGTWEGEIEYRHHDGSTVTVFSNWTFQSDERGKSPMIVETDVEARIRKAAELLRLSELRYRTIFDSLAVAVLEHDFQQVKAAFDVLRAQGVSDIRAYLADDPAFVRDLQKAVRITGAN
ncbi:MAG TPA: PAS domain-containing protein, partial [Sphingomonas sp.]|nr:PAS domain-containing protein [Sphingomonas sp.]